MAKQPTEKRVDIKIDWRVLLPGVNREQWVKAILERHPKWQTQTAEDLADWVEEDARGRGLQVENWRHVWIWRDLSTEQDERIPPSLQQWSLAEYDKSRKNV